VHGLEFDSSPAARGRGLKPFDFAAKSINAWSPAARGRGLKLRPLPAELLKPVVARRARAWIETRTVRVQHHSDKSPAARGRGLKPCNGAAHWACNGSPAARGRGLKRLWRAANSLPVRSPAARGRGLKPLIRVWVHYAALSPAARGRGLKPALRWDSCGGPQVARRARAWIETILSAARPG